MLDIQSCCLLVVDVQGKLAQLMDDKENLFKNIGILIQAANILGIPILWAQQVPDALGPTVPELAELLKPNKPINKAAFSCCGDEGFKSALERLGKKQVLLCGIETHVCIYQTAIDLLRKDYHTRIIADAVSSRTKQNKRFALRKMQSAGAQIYTTEMALFELLKTAEHPKFKQIAALIK